jgi:hypothetical protein
MDKKSFILLNDKEVNKLVSSLLLIVCLVVFPLLIVLTITGLFGIDMKQLIVFTIISFVFVLFNFILARRNINPFFVKYFSILISTMIVGMLATNNNIGIYLI